MENCLCIPIKAIIFAHHVNDEFINLQPFQ